nr:hypothetical protein [uncultured bacterium]
MNAGWNAKHADTQNTGEKLTLMKQLMNHLHSKKGQERTLPFSLWMRYKAVGQKTLSFADLGLPLRGQVSSP